MSGAKKNINKLKLEIITLMNLEKKFGIINQIKKMHVIKIIIHFLIIQMIPINNGMEKM